MRLGICAAKIPQAIAEGMLGITSNKYVLLALFNIIVLIAGMFMQSSAAIALLKYVKKGKLIITGGLLMSIGASSVLVEFFQHITFGSHMFAWSLYSASGFGFFGVFLLVAGLVRPLREHLERKFFL